MLFGVIYTTLTLDRVSTIEIMLAATSLSEYNEGPSLTVRRKDCGF
jgi:hypothetical protein